MQPDEMRRRLGTVQTYAVATTCRTCGHPGSVVIPKGERFGSDRTCPVCGCLTLTSRPSRRLKLARNG